MKKIIIYFIIIISIAYAQDWGGQSGGFLRMGLTARSLAMGGGFTAELDQNFPVFHNPAFIIFFVLLILFLALKTHISATAIRLDIVLVPTNNYFSGVFFR